MIKIQRWVFDLHRRSSDIHERVRKGDRCLDLLERSPFKLDSALIGFDDDCDREGSCFDQKRDRNDQSRQRITLRGLRLNRHHGNFRLDLRIGLRHLERPRICVGSTVFQGS